MIRGRIGVARRVHWLDDHDAGAKWATSMCGSWAGAVQLTEDVITCYNCKRIYAESRRPSPGEVHEPSGLEETCPACLLPSGNLHECRRCGLKSCADRCGGYAGGSCLSCVEKDMM